MIPESLTRYFAQYQISEAEQAKYLKELQTTGYLKIGGSAWGDGEPITISIEINVNDEPVGFEIISDDVPLFDEIEDF